jgi:hypothetical protein
MEYDSSSPWSWMVMVALWGRLEDAGVMPNLSRVVFTWTGPSVVGPGVTVTHCNQGDETSLITAMNTFFNAIKTQCPTGVTWGAPVAGDVIDELSGNVVSHWSAGASGPTLSTGNATAYANGVGARLKFPTIGIVGGRSVVGAMFIVPLTAASYEGPGNLIPACVTTLQNAAIALGTSPNALRIYSRPTSLHGGVSFPALTGVCPDAVSWLRSRRT